MQIPDDRIDEFIKHWKSTFNETITREEARTKAFQLIELYKEIGRRAPGDNATPPPSEKEK